MTDGHRFIDADNEPTRRINSLMSSDAETLVVSASEVASLRAAMLVADEALLASSSALYRGYPDEVSRQLLLTRIAGPQPNLCINGAQTNGAQGEAPSAYPGSPAIAPTESERARLRQLEETASMRTVVVRRPAHSRAIDTAKRALMFVMAVAVGATAGVYLAAYVL